MKIILRVLPALLLLSGLTPIAHAQTAPAITALTLDSEPGDWVGGGQSLVHTTSNSDISSTRNAGSLTLDVQQNNSEHYWLARVSAPTGQSFVAGATYDISRFETDTTAQLAVAGYSRSCNTTTGTLHVLEVAYDSESVIDVFAASYEQHCEGGGPALFGEIRWNSTIGFQASGPSPYSLSWASVLVGSASAPRSATLTNMGSDDLNVGEVSLSGANASDFDVTADACSNQVLAPAATCDVSITFEPGPVGSANRVAELNIADDTLRGTHLVRITGTVKKLPTSLDLSSSAKRVNFGRSLKLRGHLDVHRKTQNKSVKIWARPYGGSSKVIATKKLDRSGDFSASVRPKWKTTYWATWSGDNKYKSDKSFEKTVAVVSKVTLKLLNSYGRSGRYKLYRQRDGSLQLASVKPAGTAGTFTFTAQVLSGGRWVTGASGRIPADGRGHAAARFTGPIGTYRARVKFGGNAALVGNTSSWVYFRLT